MPFMNVVVVPLMTNLETLLSSPAFFISTAFPSVKILLSPFAPVSLFFPAAVVRQWRYVFYFPYPEAVSCQAPDCGFRSRTRRSGLVAARSPHQNVDFENFLFLRLVSRYFGYFHCRVGAAFLVLCLYDLAARAFCDCFGAGYVRYKHDCVVVRREKVHYAALSPWSVFPAFPVSRGFFLLCFLAFCLRLFFSLFLCLLA